MIPSVSSAPHVGSFPHEAYVSSHRPWIPWTAASLAFLSAFPGFARAGGFESTVAGARAVGRGGALIAASEGFDALRYNPARLSIGDRWSIGADAQLHLDRTCYDRADEAGTAYPRVCNEAAPRIVPQLG